MPGIGLGALGSFLCQFFGPRTLQVLDISNNQISAEGMRILSDSISVNIGINIENLNLSRNLIKQEGK
jgi:hypothetical protein